MLAKAFTVLARWMGGKSLTWRSRRPGVFTKVLDFIDAYQRLPAPSARELFGQLKNTAYTCAQLNAAVCASFPPRLYVATRPGQPEPKCQRQALAPEALERLHDLPHLAGCLKGAAHVEEVTEHPLLALFRSVNEEHNAWDLWELTTLYQEATGSAFWLIEMGPLQAPQRLWPLPSHAVRIVRSGDGPVVSHYEYRQGTRTARYQPEEIIHFKYPDPRDPYGPGLSPLRACYEHVLLDSEYVALKRAKFANQALPSALLVPEGVIVEEEVQRLETLWNEKLREGGQGSVLVAGGKFSVQLLQQSLGDLQALAEIGASKETVANAFGVPPPYLFRETNLANMQAAEVFHARFTIRPRLMRRDEKLNERLVPLFDPSGRLFLASDDPRPDDRALRLREQATHVRTGIRTINEVRAAQGLPPVPWGDAPGWMVQQRSK
jgi:HK97 family phage portal protein